MIKGRWGGRASDKAGARDGGPGSGPKEGGGAGKGKGWEDYDKHMSEFKRLSAEHEKDLAGRGKTPDLKKLNSKGKWARWADILNPFTGV